VVLNRFWCQFITAIDDVFYSSVHWLFPGKKLSNDVADIYAEVIHETSDDDDESNYEDEIEEEESDDEIDAVTANTKGRCEWLLCAP
jgi:hypothetical protein